VPSEVLSVRVPEGFSAKFDASINKGKPLVKGERNTAIMTALVRHMAQWCENCMEKLVLSSERGVALKEVERLKLLIGKPVIDKPRAMFPHSRKCASVYCALVIRGGNGMTSYEIGKVINEPANNVATRLKELASSGYVVQTGEKRKGERYQLDVWAVTEKEYKGL
jgi:hypothetical protein